MESKEVVVYSGNILNKSVSLPKGNESSSDDELFESLKCCLAEKKAELKGASGPLNGNALEVFAESETNDGLHSFNQPQEMGDRQDLKVTSKLFLYSLERKDIISAIDRALRCTQIDYLDNLVISFSGFSHPGSLSLENVQMAWKVLEEQVVGGKVKMIGLSDVDTQLFISVHQQASVKPGIVQINLASCCVVPPELADFCKLNGIQLLTHKDSQDVLPTDKVKQLGNLVNENCFPTEADTPSSPMSWTPNWVIRIQVHLKTRGVLATKGYVASLASVTNGIP